MFSFKNFFDKVFSKFKQKDIAQTDKKFSRYETMANEPVKKNAYNSRTIASISKRLQPSKNGNRLSSGTSGSKPLMSGGSEKTADGTMSKDNSNMKNEFDKRNANIQILPDGSMIDTRPQSWENTTRRPNRNGTPTDSDLVSRLEYNAQEGTLSAETKRGSHETTEDDGTAFIAFEQAGSKGRHAVATGNQSF